MGDATPRRGEEGSIILTVLVILVASGLIIALGSLTTRGLNQSRRAGDSASALQVADAGISEAVEKARVFESALPLPAGVSNIQGYSCSTSVVATCTRTSALQVGPAGTATVTATRDADPKQPVWHILSTGSDKGSGGQVRRVRADAVSTYGSSHALFVSANMSLKAGTEIDSYRSTLETCTGKGAVGTNDPATMNIVSGGTSGNCRGASWGYYYDGCISYADVNPPAFNPATTSCPPPPASKTVTPAFTPEDVYPQPGTPTPQQGAFGAGPCNATNPLLGGSTYYWDSVTLQDGCFIQPTAGVYEVTIFTTGDVLLEDDNNGGGSFINRPPAGCLPLGGNNDYCGGWPGKLQINMVSSNPPKQVFVDDNDLSFWGVINGPTAELKACGGCPGTRFWGSMVLAAADGTPQLELHYDESLAARSIGRFERRNWVQEPSN